MIHSFAELEMIASSTGAAPGAEATMALPLMTLAKSTIATLSLAQSHSSSLYAIIWVPTQTAVTPTMHAVPMKAVVEEFVET